MVTATYASLLAIALASVQATAQSRFSARAETPKPDEEEKATHVLCVPQTPGPHPAVRVHPAIRTRWQLIDSVVTYDLGNLGDYTDHLDKQQRKRLAIQPRVNASPTNLIIETSETMTFRLEPVPSADDAVDLVLIRPVDPETGEMIPDARCSPDEDPYRHLLDGKLSEKEVLPGLTVYFQSGAHELRMRTGPRSIGEPGMWFSFVITNTSEKSSYPPTGLALGDGHTNADYLIAWHLDDGTQNLPQELAPGETLRGALLARNAAQLRKGFVLQLLGKPAVVAAVFSWEDEPIPEPPKPEPANKGRVAIQVQGVGGTISLRNTNDANDTEFTTLWGMGGRAVYGLSRNLSVEGSLSFLSTGEAEFGDNSTTSASTVRALLGGSVHVGEKYVPYARAGLGVRVSNFTATPAVGDSDSDLRASLLLSVGVGVETWFDDSFVLGVSARYVGAISGDDESYSLEAGAHAGYAWKP